MRSYQMVHGSSGSENWKVAHLETLKRVIEELGFTKSAPTGKLMNISIPMWYLLQSTYLYEATSYQESKNLSENLKSSSLVPSRWSYY